MIISICTLLYFPGMFIYCTGSQWCLQIQIQIISGMYILCGEAMMASGSGQILEASCLQAEIVKKNEHSAYETLPKCPPNFVHIWCRITSEKAWSYFLSRTSEWCSSDDLCRVHHCRACRNLRNPLPGAISQYQSLISHIQKRVSWNNSRKINLSQVRKKIWLAGNSVNSPKK